MNPLAQWFTWEGAPCQVCTRSVKLAGLSSKSTCNICCIWSSRYTFRYCIPVSNLVSCWVDMWLVPSSKVGWMGRWMGGWFSLRWTQDVPLLNRSSRLLFTLSTYLCAFTSTNPEFFEKHRKPMNMWKIND